MRKITPVQVLTPDLVKQARELALEADRLEGGIVARIHYIMTSIFNLFGQKHAYWYFYGAEEGEQGDLWKHYDESVISVVVDNCSEEMLILLKDGNIWGLNDSILTRWLYEDFMTELVEGKKKYQQKMETEKAAKKVKGKQEKEEIKKLIEEARAKLSKKEWMALKKSL